MIPFHFLHVTYHFLIFSYSYLNASHECVSFIRLHPHLPCFSLLEKYEKKIHVEQHAAKYLMHTPHNCQNHQNKERMMNCYSQEEPNKAMTKCSVVGTLDGILEQKKRH